MRIITISREFGSGGREFGKRLAEELGFQYYDKEILSIIAENTKQDEEYISRKLERGYVKSIPLTFGRSMSGAGYKLDTMNLLIEQQKVIKEIAKKGEDFVIVGRNADVILKEYHPFNIFVYADLECKVKRCMAREEDVDEKALLKQMKMIDAGRKKCRELLSSTAWGDKANYHLCINTSDVELSQIVPAVAAYITNTFGGTK